MPTNPYRGAHRGRGFTKTQAMHLERLMLNAQHLESEDLSDYDIQHLIPVAWDTLERDVDVEEKKVKITLRLDESVAKFYRAMGTGYQARMNRILATFAQMRMGQVMMENARVAAAMRDLRESMRRDRDDEGSM